MIESVIVPDSIAGATVALASPRCRLIAGGTLVMPEVNAGTDAITSLVSLRRLPLATVKIDKGMATIGAGVTLSALAEQSELHLLRPALDKIASPTIRNMATAGGNLFAKTPYGDLTACFIALEVSADIAGRDGIRSVRVEDLVRDGIGHDEFVIAITFHLPAPGAFRFHKAARRALNSAAIITVAAVVEYTDSNVTNCRIGLAGVAPAPIRARSVEAMLTGKPFDAAHVAIAASAVAADIAPETDACASAWYRARVSPVHVERALLHT